MLGRYESGEAKEVVLCHPAREYFPPSEELCNFTRENGGMSWYCEKPKDKQLLCEDWASIRGTPQAFFLQTNAERLLSR